MGVAKDMTRKTVTIPLEHSEVYEEEVKIQRRRGIRTTVAELIRKAIAKDVKRIQRSR